MDWGLGFSIRAILEKEGWQDEQMGLIARVSMMLAILMNSRGCYSRIPDCILPKTFFLHLLAGGGTPGRHYHRSRCSRCCLNRQSVLNRRPGLFRQCCPCRRPVE